MNGKGWPENIPQKTRSAPRRAQPKQQKTRSAPRRAQPKQPDRLSLWEQYVHEIFGPGGKIISYCTWLENRLLENDGSSLSRPKSE